MVSSLILVSVFSIAVCVIPENASATTRYVGGGGPGNYTTLYDALIDANPGDTIYVYNGTYYERITLSIPLTLIGEDRNTTVIHGSESKTIVHVVSDSVNITGFSITKSGTGLGNSGILLDNVQHCNISNNRIMYTRYGVYLSYSNNNIVTDNYFSLNYRYAIHMSYSAENVITNNEIVDDGIYIYGDALNHWTTHTIDTSNTVNGKPVYYWKDAIGGTVPSGAGQVILANCTNVLVENQNVSDGSVGIELGFSSSNTIANNTASSSDRFGLYLAFSHDNTIVNNTANSSGYTGIYILASNSNNIIGNTASRNLWYNIAVGSSQSNSVKNNTAWYSDYHGIYLTSSSRNKISGNAVSYSDYQGIYLASSSQNTISDNVLTLNGVHGILLASSASNTIVRNKVYWNQHYAMKVTSFSAGNRIYHNDFVFNAYQVFDDTSMNNWANGYPSGGNYYSDYTGIDEKYGPNQDQPGVDGIGDTGYYVQGGGVDPYPLMSPPPPPLLPPVAPQNLKATAGNQQATLTWSAPPFDGRSAITNYVVYRGTAPGGETFLTEIGNVLTYLDQGLTIGQTYYYRISAKNAVGEGSQSNEANTTPADVPGEPLNLIASEGNEEITITWSQPSDDGGSPISNYRIFRGTSSGEEIFLLDVGVVLTYVDNGLVNGQMYYYRVSAENSMGQGPKSNVANAMPGFVPGPPTGLAAHPSNSKINLVWSPPTDTGGLSILNYRIYRGLASGELTLLETVGNVLNYTDTNLTNGVMHFYKVSAANGVGEGPLSEEVFSIPSYQLPTCMISNPISGATVSGLFQISGVANDPDGPIQTVEVRIDHGSWFEATGSASWTFDWDTSGVGNGEHTIYARSFDGTNYSNEVSVTVTVENVPSQEPQDEWMWIVVGLVIVVLVVLLTLYLLTRRKKKKEMESDESPEARFGN